MAVLSDILAKVRLELADQPKSFTKNFAGDGSTTEFELGFTPVDSSSLLVTIDGTPIPQPAGYTIDENHGTISFSTEPAALSVVQVAGSYYRYFTDTDLTHFINTSVAQHTFNRTDSFGSLVTISSIPAVEDYPLTILSTIEALWALATDSAFDIDIHAPDGVSIPRSERFRQLSQLIQSRMDQYKQLCSALNIGLWRIEMGTLRRVSRTTNKLVPLYVSQEIDDSRRPERVYMQNDLLGRTPVPSAAQIYDITFTQGDSYEVEFDFPFDTTGLVFKAQIRTYPNSPALYATFDTTVISTSATVSRIKLSLISSTTAYLPVRSFWDLQATSLTDTTYQNTFIKGQVFAGSQVTLD